MLRDSRDPIRAGLESPDSSTGLGGLPDAPDLEVVPQVRVELLDEDVSGLLELALHHPRRKLVVGRRTDRDLPGLVLEHGETRAGNEHGAQALEVGDPILQMVVRVGHEDEVEPRAGEMRIIRRSEHGDDVPGAVRVDALAHAIELGRLDVAGVDETLRAGSSEGDGEESRSAAQIADHRIGRQGELLDDELDLEIGDTILALQPFDVPSDIMVPVMVAIRDCDDGPGLRRG